MDQRITNIADQIYSGLVHELGRAWANRLTPVEDELVRECCADAADLQVRALAVSQDATAQQQLLREKAQINAQFANLAATHAGQVADVFWHAVRSLVQGAVVVAFAAV